MHTDASEQEPSVFMDSGFAYGPPE
jgi:hypothetical protein